MDKHSISMPSFIKKNIHLIVLGAFCSFAVSCATVYTGLTTGSFLLSAVFASVFSALLATVIMRKRDGARITLLQSAMISASMIAACMSSVLPGAINNTAVRVNVPATYFLSPTISGFGDYFANKKLYAISTSQIAENAAEGESVAVLTVPIILISIAALVLGILIAWMLRAKCVTDKSLNFPEAVVSSEIMSLGSVAHGRKHGLDAPIAAVISAGFTFLREKLYSIPFSLQSKALKLKSGIDIGLVLSPMIAGFGYIAGLRRGIFMLIGSLLAHVVATPAMMRFAGFDFDKASSLRLQAGMGLLLGIGIGVFADHVLKRMEERENRIERDEIGYYSPVIRMISNTIKVGVFVIAYILLCVGGVSPVIALILVPTAYFACCSVAMVRGGSGVFTGTIPAVLGASVVMALDVIVGFELVDIFLAVFFVAAVCATAGEHINAYKTGSLIGASAKQQLFMMCVGGTVGTVSALIFFLSSMSSDLTAVTPVAQQIKEAFFAGASPAVILLSAALSAAFVLMGLPVGSFTVGVLLPFSYGACFFFGSVSGAVAKRFTKNKNGVAVGLITGECAIVFLFALIGWIGGF